MCSAGLLDSKQRNSNNQACQAYWAMCSTSHSQTSRPANCNLAMSRRSTSCSLTSQTCRPANHNLASAGNGFATASSAAAQQRNKTTQWLVSQSCAEVITMMLNPALLSILVTPTCLSILNSWRGANPAAFAKGEWCGLGTGSSKELPSWALPAVTLPSLQAGDILGRMGGRQVRQAVRLAP